MKQADGLEPKSLKMR